MVYEETTIQWNNHYPIYCKYFFQIEHPVEEERMVEVVIWFWVAMFMSASCKTVVLGKAVTSLYYASTTVQLQKDSKRQQSSV